MQHFQKGINLGGWLSQYPLYSLEHFDSFITEKDIKRIASWGMDHVRLPVDYAILERDEEPFIYREEGFRYIDHCLEWVNRYGLNLVLDLHSAQGFDFRYPEKTTLFTDQQQQERYIKLWQTIARRYQHETDNLAFDLLNEIVLPESLPWNRLYIETIHAIRTVSPERWLIVGGINYNSIFTLEQLEVVDDPYIAYTFHFYEPLPFTHQKAHWMPILKYYNQKLAYPGKFEGLSKLIDDVHSGRAGTTDQFDLKKYDNVVLDNELVMREFQPARDFIARTGKLLYCGEYGVINRAPDQSMAQWTSDVHDLCKPLGIGKAYWCYKEMDFGLVNSHGQVLNEELLAILKDA